MDDTAAKDETGKDMGTRYKIASMMNDQYHKWVRISFDALDDTTSAQHSQKRQKNGQQPPRTQQSISSERKSEDGDSTNIPASVLQYERQLRKTRAADRASKTNVNVKDHLKTIYSDDHIVVTNKPSGILCVPGVNKNKSLLDLVHEVYGSANETYENSAPAESSFPRDSMIVHRLDMDTSGIVIFARNRLAMSNLHKSFRERTGTKKVYEALLVGWLDTNVWIKSADGKGDYRNDVKSVGKKEDKNKQSEDAVSIDDVESLGGGEIHLPLQRDHRHPPFMRVSTPESEAEARQAVNDLNHNGYKKLIAKKPKPSTTQFRILSYEKWHGHPVTRVELIPITGRWVYLYLLRSSIIHFHLIIHIPICLLSLYLRRTHQLRVHCAAMGHPILGDPAYGFCGEAHPNGGFSDELISKLSPTCAAFELRRSTEDTVREKGVKMCLHAKKLSIDHPVTGNQESFEVEPSF